MLFIFLLFHNGVHLYRRVPRNCVLEASSVGSQQPHCPNGIFLSSSQHASLGGPLLKWRPSLDSWSPNFSWIIPRTEGTCSPCGGDRTMLLVTVHVVQAVEAHTAGTMRWVPYQGWGRRAMSQSSQRPLGGWQVHPEGSDGPELKGTTPTGAVLCQCFILLPHDLTIRHYVTYT